MKLAVAGYTHAQITIPIAVMLWQSGILMRALSECSKFAKKFATCCVPRKPSFKILGYATGNISLSELSIKSVSPEGVYGQYSISHGN